MTEGPARRAERLPVSLRAGGLLRFFIRSPQQSAPTTSARGSSAWVTARRAGMRPVCTRLTKASDPLDPEGASARHGAFEKPLEPRPSRETKSPCDRARYTLALYAATNSHPPGAAPARPAERCILPPAQPENTGSIGLVRKESALLVKVSRGASSAPGFSIGSGT